MPRLLFVVAISFLVSACGFTPLYGSGGENRAAEASLASIAVETPTGEERLNRLAEDALIEALAPDGMRSATPAFRLETRLRDSRRGLLIQDDTSITRYNFRVTATWRLIDPAGDRVVAEGKATSTVSYNVADSPFSTVIAREDAERRAVREIADEIRLRLAMALSGPDCCRAKTGSQN